MGNSKSGWCLSGQHADTQGGCTRPACTCECHGTKS